MQTSAPPNLSQRFGSSSNMNNTMPSPAASNPAAAPATASSALSYGALKNRFLSSGTNATPNAPVMTNVVPTATAVNNPTLNTNNNAATASKSKSSSKLFSLAR